MRSWSQIWLTPFMPDSNQEDFMMAIKLWLHPVLISAAAHALLLLTHKYATELSYPPEGRQRGWNKPLLAQLSCSDSPACLPLSPRRSACWAILEFPSPRWIELRGSGSSEIVLSGLPRGVSIHVHQHELRQRTVRSSTNIAAVLCTQKQTVSDSQCASSHRHTDASVQLDPDTHFILLVLLSTCLTTTDTLLTSKEVMVQQKNSKSYLCYVILYYYCPYIYIYYTMGVLEWGPFLHNRLCLQAPPAIFRNLRYSVHLRRSPHTRPAPLEVRVPREHG